MPSERIWKQFPVWKRSWKPGRSRVRQERQAENWDPDLSRPCRHWSFLYRTVFLRGTKGKKRASRGGLWCLLWSGRNRRKRSTGTFYLCTDLCDGHKLRKNDSIKSVFRSEALKRMLSTSAGTDKKSDRTRRRMARTFRTGI